MIEKLLPELRNGRRVDGVRIMYARLLSKL